MRSQKVCPGAPSSVYEQLQIERCGQGPSLILVHGIQGTLESWYPVIPELNDFTVVLVNMPGRGTSPRCAATDAPDFYSVDHFADLINLAIETEVSRTGQRVSIAGWSMGVTVLLRLWDRHGGKGIHRMALLSGTPVARQASWFKSISTDDIKLEANERAVKLGMKNVADPAAVAWALKSARALDLREVLPRVACDVLVMHGERDDQSPVDQGRMIAKGIRGARYVQLDGLGHSILAEAPRTIGYELKAFFSGKTPSVFVTSN